MRIGGTIQRLVFGGAVFLLTVASPARLAAQVPLVRGGPWELFEWFLGPGMPVEGPGFSVSSPTDPIRVRVTDAGFTGDAFDVFVNGVLFPTPSVPGGTNTGALTADAAWADPRLSKLAIDLDPGTYLITLAVREAASGFDFGEGFIRADVRQVTPGIVPEPGTVVLLVTGLAALGLVARRRRG